MDNDFKHRYPFTMGELHAGSNGMKCENIVNDLRCGKLSWSVWLSAKEWRTVWSLRDRNAGLVINEKKLGIVLCDTCAPKIEM